LLSWFVKDYKNTQNSHIREKCASVAGIVGIVSNLFLSVMKLVIGLLTGSIAIMADAINNLTDAGSSIITLVGFRLAEKPADAEHPYGHERIEYITGLIVSMVITILGVEFFLDSLKSLFAPTETEYTPTVFVVLILSILVKLWQCGFYITVGRHIDSETLIATASDSRNDVLTTAAVLLGAFISALTKVNLDSWLGLTVAGFIIWSGARLIAETANPLLGIAPTKEFMKQIGDKLLSYDGILGYHDLVVHNYGPDRCFASVHAEVSANENILVSHDLVDNIEFAFLREMGIHMVIHMDPVVTGDAEIDLYHSEVADIVGKCSVQLGTVISMHDFRVVRGQTHINLIFDIAIPFDCKESDSNVRNEIAAEIQKMHPNCNAVITCDRG